MTTEAKTKARLAAETAQFCLKLVTDKLHEGKISMGEFQQHKAMLEHWYHRQLTLVVMGE